MSFLDRLEQNLGRYGVPGITQGLIALQVIAFSLSFAKPDLMKNLFLIPERVMQGEVWRLFTFLVVPPVTNPIFVFFFWYLFFLMGTSLESHWGAFRYNIYLFTGYIATVAAAWIAPAAASSNAFLQASVFLAFAFLFPDFQLYVFFVIPVKIKWLAALTWVSYFFILIFGQWLSRFLILASITNFLLFFGKDLIERARTGRRHMSFQASKFAQQPSGQPFHRCTICGVTDISNPDMEFRYCTECAGTPGYCADHVHNHEHLKQV